MSSHLLNQIKNKDRLLERCYKRLGEGSFYEESLLMVLKLRRDMRTAMKRTEEIDAVQTN